MPFRDAKVESRKIPETLRYFAGMDEPVPRNASSKSPGFRDDNKLGNALAEVPTEVLTVSLGKVLTVSLGKVRTTASRLGKVLAVLAASPPDAGAPPVRAVTPNDVESSSLTRDATRGVGIELQSKPALSNGTRVNLSRLLPGSVTGACRVFSPTPVAFLSSLSLACVSTAWALVRIAFCVFSSRSVLFLGSGNINSSIECSRALIAAAARKTGTAPVAMEYTIRCLGFVARPSVSEINAGHVSIHSVYSVELATSPGARCTTTARSPVSVFQISFAPSRCLYALELGSETAARCAAVGRSITKNRNPHRGGATTSIDFIILPSGNVTSSPRTNCPLAAPRGTPSESAFAASNFPGMPASWPRNKRKCQSRVGRVLDDVWTNSHRPSVRTVTSVRDKT